MFHLTKWYLDVVTDDGAAIVAYAARLTWGRLRLGYTSLLHSVASSPAHEVSAFGRTSLPIIAGDCLTWRAISLAVEGEWRRLAPPIQRQLLHSNRGELVWTCEMPRSQAALTFDGRCHRGLGYVEHLSLTIPPWKLPFHQLRWGRYVSAAHSVVWIDWGGVDNRSFVWLEGIERAEARLHTDGVSLPDGYALRLGSPRDLCARPALTHIIDALPRRLGTMAGPLAAMFEHKMIAPGQILCGDQPIDSGWSIFEEVRW